MMNKELPLVSVIIPCYNQEEYIVETVDSVLAQTYPKLEIIIVNDGSTDNSDETIQKILSKNPEIRYLKVPNGGVSKARNIGIENALGKYILPLDADDLIAPKYTEVAINEFLKNPDLTVVTAKAKFFEKEDGDWNLANFSVKKMLHGNVIFCSSFFKKEDWKKVGGFDESMNHLEDWEFFIRLTCYGNCEVLKLDYLAFYYRIKHVNSRNAAGFDDGTHHNTSLYIYNKHKNLFFKYHGNPLMLIKEIDQLKWELEKKNREINYLNKFFFNKFLNKLRKIKNAK